MEPIVSVVIRTHLRPLLVKRAVESVFAQTLKQIEVIVVINGIDVNQATREVLATIDDPRLSVLELPTNQGCCVALNAGIATAKAKWIAPMDDDDEWMPQKLERQLEAVRHSQHPLPIATCYLIARRSTGDSILPRRLPKPSEPLSEYLFVRNTLFQGEGEIQGSTILTSKELLEKVPVLKGTEVHADWDWLLRAIAVEGVGIEFVPEPLSVWNIGDAPSGGRAGDWKYSLNWIQSVRKFITPRAYSSFILSIVSARAALVGDRKAFWLLLWEAIRHGKPQLTDLGLCLGMWLIPPGTRRWLRILLTREGKVLPTRPA
jgi:glycosyltransferase involved in cell wall biosynthesis